MIICVCSNVSDKKIRSIMAEGCSYREMLLSLKVSQNKDCGKCTSSVKRIVSTKKVKPMTRTEMFKQDYIIHSQIVGAEKALANNGWKAEATVAYNIEEPTNPNWGIRYIKNDKIIWMNRFTAHAISAAYD